MVAGGTEACVDPLTVAGFAKMRALTKHSDPLTASAPFDAKRSGFVIGMSVYATLVFIFVMFMYECKYCAYMALTWFVLRLIR